MSSLPCRACRVAPAVSSLLCRACLVAPAARVHPGRIRQPSFPDHPFSPQMRVGLGRSRRPLRHLDRPARPSILTAQDGGAASRRHHPPMRAHHPRATSRFRSHACSRVLAARHAPGQPLPGVRTHPRYVDRSAVPLPGARVLTSASTRVVRPASRRLLMCSTQTLDRPLSVHPMVRAARQRVVRMELFAR